MEYDSKNGGSKKTSFSKDKETANDVFNSIQFKADWISQNADKDLVVYAEAAGIFMAKNGLTNSKIRSIYGEIKRIQMGDFKKEEPSFYLLKPKVAYALGRDPRNEGLILFKKIFDKCFDYVNDSRTFQNFSNLLEAVLAYHKANGGKD